VRFLLDTDHISILQRQSGPEFAALMARIARVPRADLAFCITIFHEQGLGTGRRPSTGASRRRPRGRRSGLPDVCSRDRARRADARRAPSHTTGSSARR